jgi:group I intron endonuclease
MGGRDGIVYVITCPEGLQYVGKTKQQLGKRVAQHRLESSNCRLIRGAFKKHGDAMKVSVLMLCSSSDLERNESFYIEKLDTVHPRGYNLQCGSLAGVESTGMELSTFVHEPVSYTDSDEMTATMNAVWGDISGITGETVNLTWSGPIQLSVKDLNDIRGAKQHCPWAGPVKGVPLSVSFKDHFEEMSYADRSIALKKAEIEERANIEIASHRIKTEKQAATQALEAATLQALEAATLQALEAKIASAGRMGFEERAQQLKRKLEAMLGD